MFGKFYVATRGADDAVTLMPLVEPSRNESRQPEGMAISRGEERHMSGDRGWRQSYVVFCGRIVTHDCGDRATTSGWPL